MMTLRQLRYFASLAELGHFGRAAEACAVSQPALSQQIADLEADLGTRLVDRTSRGAVITEAGQVIAVRARAILASVNDLASASRGSTDLAGPLRLGIIPTVAPFLLPSALPKMQTLFPLAEFRVREAMSATLIAELSAGILDLIILAMPVVDAGIETLPLFDDQFMLVSAASEAPSAPIQAGALDTTRLLLLDDGHCLRDQALSACGMADASLRAQLGATSLATLVQLVAAGLGQTLVPAMALDALVTHDVRVKATLFAAPAPSRMIGLAYRATTSDRASFARLGEVISI